MYKNKLVSMQHEESPVDSAYGSDKKPEFEDNPAAAPGSKLDRTFSKLSSDNFKLVPASKLDQTFSKLSSDDFNLVPASKLDQTFSKLSPDDFNLVPGSNLNRTFSKLSSDDISLSSCSDLSSVSTIKRPDSNNYDSVIRYVVEVFFNVKTTIQLLSR